MEIIFPPKIFCSYYGFCQLIASQNVIQDPYYILQDIWNKTWYPKAADHINSEKTWYIVDATDKILGRLASTIAIHIRGKNLVTYTPSVDMGAYVIVVCIMKVAVSVFSISQGLIIISLHNIMATEPAIC